MRLLVVEDEVRLAEALKRGLEAEGFEVDLAFDGKEGLALALGERYEAIVLDILLPGLNGYRVCAEIRAAGNWTPILMLTAKSGEFDEAEALDTGADDFLSKPFSYVVLVARLRALVRRGSGPRPAPCQVGDLRLDPAARTCDRGGVPIHLTPREVDLLEVLMSRAGEVVGKTELLERVWGPDSDVDPNVVEVYLGYLRRKIDRPFDRDTLRTIRGAGYVLAAD
ncbi:MAG: DNA-binding response regulator [Actinobacteria bacterium RBG_16_70_17]|nr:MAG: DNA-binding response regulator [Actinobacteria bacterium RBG_16_70_17]